MSKVLAKDITDGMTVIDPTDPCGLHLFVRTVRPEGCVIVAEVECTPDGAGIDWGWDNDRTLLTVDFDDVDVLTVVEWGV